MPRRRPRSERTAHLTALPFSYPEVGATRTTTPSGYRTTDLTRTLGAGRDRFEVASHRLLTWDMHRRAGLLVDASGPPTTAGCTAVLRIGFGRLRIPAPVRVVYVVDEPTARGFAYGTLPGHPETGEERFVVRMDPDGTVRAELSAFSRPGSWLTRLGGPVARRVQAGVTEGYLAALAAP